MVSDIKTYAPKTEEIVTDHQLNLTYLKNLFQDDYIPQILFFISMAVKNNKFKSISFVNDMNQSIVEYEKITEPWLAAISGFKYLSEITGVQKFEEINSLIKDEKPFIKKDRKIMPKDLKFDFKFKISFVRIINPAKIQN